ncbi:MAG TPA: hypothetical protein VFV52_06075 [Bacilli bacterium]|nr:hypothetical protein [Bacilli bacterium]
MRQLIDTHVIEFLLLAGEQSPEQRGPRNSVFYDRVLAVWMSYQADDGADAGHPFEVKKQLYTQNGMLDDFNDGVSLIGDIMYRFRPNEELARRCAKMESYGQDPFSDDACKANFATKAMIGMYNVQGGERQGILDPFKSNRSALRNTSSVNNYNKGNASSGSGSSSGKENSKSENSNKLFWGSWSDYPKVKVNGREYAQIGERLYTHHAVDRMQPSGMRYSSNSVGGKVGHQEYMVLTRLIMEGASRQAL